jgi:hypothetical protein
MVCVPEINSTALGMQYLQHEEAACQPGGHHRVGLNGPHEEQQRASFIMLFCCLLYQAPAEVTHGHLF